MRRIIICWLLLAAVAFGLKQLLHYMQSFGLGVFLAFCATFLSINLALAAIYDARNRSQAAPPPRQSGSQSPGTEQHWIDAD
jgi:hypothetical protein